MINLDDYPILRNNKDTLKELSKDDSDISNIKYMTESNSMAVNFDKVKRIYVNTLGLSEESATSVDGLTKNNTDLLFIEFKNGEVKNRNVKDKIRDSLLLFCDITNTDISYTRQHAQFILVYNEEKNPLPNQYKKSCTQPSKSSLFKNTPLISSSETIFVRPSVQSITISPSFRVCL